MREEAQLPRPDSGDYCRERHAQNRGEIHDARVHGCGALDGLEPDREEEHDGDHAGTAEERIDHPSSHGADLHDSRGHGRQFLPPDLDADECDEEDGCEDE